VISSVFIGFVFRDIYIFMRDRVAPSKMSSRCRSDYLHENSFFIVIITTYFTNHTSAIHSVKTGLTYALFMLLFSKPYKIYCFNPPFMPYADGKQHEEKYCTAGKYCRNTHS